jgi:hypothetical protein
MYSELTSTELARSQAAVSYLTGHAKLLRLDAQIVAKLSSVQSALAVEAEDREAIVTLPQRALRNG